MDKKEMFKLDKDKFVAVTFKTKDDGRLGPIIIYIEPRNL